jgi:hypothetical protein
MLHTHILGGAISTCGFNHIPMTSEDSISECGTPGQFPTQVCANDTALRGAIKCKEVTD